MSCPQCNSNNIVKNGGTQYGKQRFKCQNCGRRQFVESPTRQPIDYSRLELIDQLLLERLSLAAIARITDVSLRWLQYYQIPKYVEVTKKNQVG